MQETFAWPITFHSKEVTMNCNMPIDPQFDSYYRKHLKCLKLNGLQRRSTNNEEGNVLFQPAHLPIGEAS